MPLIAAHGIRMHFGGPLVLDGVSLKLEPGARIGLIGRNGSGKSTLLKLLAGRLEPVEGSVTRARGVRAAYQAQELEVRAGRTVLEEMRGVFQAEARREAELRAIEERLAVVAQEPARRRLLAEYERLQQQQEQAGVYDTEHHIASLLSSLGLPESAWHQPVEGFSGGERNIIGLARALLSAPDVLLLDEPSNHLDMEGVEWFIDFLRRTRAAVLMVSHNRHLLDVACREIWELRRARVTRWSGNYSDYQRQKAEAVARQARQHKAQQRLIQRIEFQARRLKDMANAYDDPAQAKRAKAMLRRIERMDKVERPDTAEHTFGARLEAGPRHGRIALTVSDFHFAYGQRKLFAGANLEIEYGDRVCLVGPNGSGKTTLFREILTRGSWENPELRLGKSTRVGEYRQLHDALDPEQTLADWATEITGQPRNEAAALLHRFLFKREDLERRIATLSGGEKSRLQLARLVHQRVNFLMLDEPTNHLDIQACEQLEEMLQGFEGTLFVISHDRYFLDKLVSRVVEIRERRLVDHPVTFAAWWRRWMRKRDRGRRGALEARRFGAAGKEEARQAFEARRHRQRELNRLLGRRRELEAQIGRAEAKEQQLEAAVESAFVPGADRIKGEQLAADLEALRVRVAQLYAAWEQIEAALEAHGESADGSPTP